MPKKAKSVDGNQVRFCPVVKQKKPVKQSAKRKPSESKKRKDISHGGGPIGARMSPLNGANISKYYMSTGYTKRQIDEHVMNMAVSAVAPPSASSPPRLLTAAESKNTTPVYFHNNMQDIDYIFIEAILGNTIVGPFMDIFTKFVIGKGFKPELVLRRPTGDSEKDKKLLEKRADIIETLTQIDEAVDENSADASLVDKFAACIGNMNSYNRSALFFGYNEPVEVDTPSGRKAFSEIPDTLFTVHPRDLGIIKVTEDTWAVDSIQYSFGTDMIKAKNMIYFWNPQLTAKHYHSWLYGGSMLQPTLDAARTLQNIMSVDFPAMAYGSWAGHSIISIKPQGQTEGEKMREYDSVAATFDPGASSLFLEDPKNMSVHSVDYNPHVNEFVGLTNYLLKYIISSIGLPYSLLIDEGDATRATAMEKVRWAMSVVIEPLREQISRMVTKQWYHRWYKLVFSQDPDYKLYDVKLVFNDFDMAQWYDKINEFRTLNSMYPHTVEAAGEMLGIDNFKDNIDTDKIPTEGGIEGVNVTTPNGDNYVVDTS